MMHKIKKCEKLRGNKRKDFRKNANKYKSDTF